MKKPYLSIVIPAYNEQDNVILLHKAINNALKEQKFTYEIIFVDDGSKDKTFMQLMQIKESDNKVVIVKFRRNFGQTAAFDAGFKQAQGDVVITMDADLQNDPTDIPRMLAKLDGGYDLIATWRKRRKDTFMKNFISRGAYMMRKVLFKDKLHDSNCALKAFRKECLENLTLFGETHRFIPNILQQRGFMVGEIVVKHHPRKFGKTKYGLSRILRSILDMIIVKFWMQYSARPMHLFGGIGIFMGALGFLTGLYITILKFAYGQSADRPLLLLAVLLIILGVQFLIFGVLADILIKIYYKDTRTYTIEKVLI